MRCLEAPLNTRNGPNSTDIHALPLNSDVLVWREGNTGQSGKWEGPFKLISMDGESCILALPHGNTAFRSTSVKPYLQPQSDHTVSIPEDTITVQTDNNNDLRNDLRNDLQNNLPKTIPKRGRGRPRKVPLVFYLDDTIIPEIDYSSSRKSEVLGLIEKGVFQVVQRAEIPPNTRIFNSRFVDEIKHKGTNMELMKSRLVVQAYNDTGKQLVLTQSPTIQRVSQRLILCIAMITKSPIYLRDISQAYVQSTTTLNRDFYINPPEELAREMKLQSHQAIQVVKPLYGVQKSETTGSRHTKHTTLRSSQWSNLHTTHASYTALHHSALSAFRPMTPCS